MRVVFIDRDGTMGGGYNIEYPWEYKPFPNTYDAFGLLKKHEFVPVIFTNQSCIARGKSGSYDFDKEFAEIGAFDWFICPHDTPDQCSCRKPKPGLLLQAKEKYNLDLSQCYVIGDRWSDMKAGGMVGCRLIPVRTGRGEETMGIDRNKWIEYQPVYVAEDLYVAVCWLVKQDEGK